MTLPAHDRMLRRAHVERIPASRKVYAHSRMDKRMEAQAKMIDAMGQNEKTVRRIQ